MAVDLGGGELGGGNFLAVDLAGGGVGGGDLLDVDLLGSPTDDWQSRAALARLSAASSSRMSSNSLAAWET